HVHHGAAAAPPTAVIGPVVAATAGNAGIPLGKSHLELSHRERHGDRHLVHGFFTVVLLRAHHELTRWNNYHPRASVAVPEAVLGLEALLLVNHLCLNANAPRGRWSWRRYHRGFGLRRRLRCFWRNDDGHLLLLQLINPRPRQLGEERILVTRDEGF